MSAPTVEAGHTSGWLVRDDEDALAALSATIQMEGAGVVHDIRYRKIEPDTARRVVALRTAIDAALFRLSCSPCGECGGDAKRYGGEYGDRESWLHCSTCCLPDGRSRWSELRVEPGFVPVECDGGCVRGEIPAQPELTISQPASWICPAGCFRGWRVAP